MNLLLGLVAAFMVTTTGTWYGEEHHGRLMASGQSYNMNAPTVATNDYPLGTKLLICNEELTKCTVAEVTDRMRQDIKNHIDLSKYGFGQLAPHSKGVITIKVLVLPD